jgi:hypothetical protein
MVPSVVFGAIGSGKRSLFLTFQKITSMPKSAELPPLRFILTARPADFENGPLGIECCFLRQFPVT